MPCSVRHQSPQTWRPQHSAGTQMTISMKAAEMGNSLKREDMGVRFLSNCVPKCPPCHCPYGPLGRSQAATTQQYDADRPGGSGGSWGFDLLHREPVSSKRLLGNSITCANCGLLLSSPTSFLTGSCSHSGWIQISGSPNMQSTVLAATRPLRSSPTSRSHPQLPYPEISTSLR